jgi:tetratricopeptide (TPR) repeat protein
MTREPATGGDDLAREELDRLVQESVRQRRDDRPAEAEGTLRRALDLAERAWGPGSPQSALVLADMGRCRVADGRFEAAEAVYRQALEIERQLDNVPSSQVGVLLHDLAVVCEALGRASEATELWAEGRALFEQREQAEA